MPIRIDNDLPVKQILEEENIFVMDENRSNSQDIRPIDILILNLMPLKEDTELQLLRSLSNTPLQVNITFVRTMSYESKHTSREHLEKFYSSFKEVKKRKWDGMIITGAPVEKMKFEEVEYWTELTKIMDWASENVTSTLHICWGAQAGLYYHYGVNKYELPKKLSGIYEHHTMHKSQELVRGFDDSFLAPHSRYTGIDANAVRENPNLVVLAERISSLQDILNTIHLHLIRSTTETLAKELIRNFRSITIRTMTRTESQLNHGDAMLIHFMRIGSIITYIRARLMTGQEEWRKISKKLENYSVNEIS